MAEADAESAGSGQLPQNGEKRFLTLGRAETKKLAKKGREQRQKRKRKAEGLSHALYNIFFLIGHFRVALNLIVRARLSATFLLRKL